MITVEDVRTGEEFENFLAKLKPIFIKTNSFADKKGTDFICQGMRIQVKFDKTIEKSGNIWYEKLEKSKGKEDQKWRESPCNADLIIFGTRDKQKLKWYYIYKETIEKVCKKENMIKINVLGQGFTSKGFLLKINKDITPLITRQYP